MSGKSEELTDGVVYHNDQGNLPASWKGRDPESGIDHYLVAIGTIAGMA